MTDEVIRLVVDASGATIDVASFEAAMKKAGDTADRSMDQIAKGAIKAQAAGDPAFAALAKRNNEVEQTYQRVQKAVAVGIMTNDAAARAVQNVSDKHLAMANAASIAAKDATKLSEVMAIFESRALGMSSSLGVVGTVLGVIGGPMLAVLVLIGSIILAMEAASASAHMLADEAKGLQKFAEQTGLSTDQLQALTQASVKHGVGAEEATQAVVRFTSAWAQARDGGGAFLTQLRAIDPGLADQIQRTKDVTVALGLLAQAIKAADAAGDVAKRNQLARAAAGGRNVAGILGVSEAISAGGGLGNLTAEAEAAGMIINKDLLKVVRDLGLEVDATKKHADLLFAAIGAKPVLEAEVSWQHLRVEMAQLAAAMADAEQKKGFWEWFFDKLAQASSEGRADILPKFNLPSGAEPSAVWGPSPERQGPEQGGPKSLKAQVADLKLLQSLQGDSTTLTEKLALKELELKEAVDADKTATVALAAARGLAAAQLDTTIAKEIAHIAALGIAATVTDRVRLALDELQKKQNNDAALSPAQLTNAQRLIQAQADGSFALNAQTNAIRVHSATLNMSVGEAAAYNVIQTKTNEAIAKGLDPEKEITAAVRASAAAFGSATQAAEAYKNSLDIKRDRQTMFLSADDLAIADKLKGQYKDVATALNSAEASQMRFNVSVKGTRDDAAEFAKTFVHALIDGKSKAEAFGDALKAIGNKMLDKGIDQAVNVAMATLFQTTATSMGATWITSATAAAAILTGGGVAAGTATATGGTVSATANSLGGAAAGTAVATGGEVAAVELAAGGTAAGMAMMGPLALIFAAIAALAAATGLLGGGAKAQQKQQDITSSIGRLQGYDDRAATAGLDTTTLAGQLQAFDIKADRERATEAAKPYAQMAALERALSAERLAIYKQFNDAVLKQAQQIRDYAESLKTGSLSTASPTEQLAILQASYDADLAKAKAGDQTAAGNVTKDADVLLKMAQSMFASSTAYSVIFDKVYGQLSTFELGGRVTGGTPGIDSVPVMVQQDEFIVNAAAARQNMPILQAINAGAMSRGFANGGSVRSFGSAPTVTASGDGSNAAIEALGKFLSRTMVATTTAHIETLQNELGGLRSEVRRLNDTTRIEASRAVRPGRKTAP